MQRGILGVPVRHSQNLNPGLKNQKVLHGTFPIEGGGRSQVTLKSFRKSPVSFQHAIKRVVMGIVRSKHAKRRHGRSADKTRQRGLPGHLNGSSEKGFAMRARGRSRHIKQLGLRGDRISSKASSEAFGFCGYQRFSTVYRPFMPISNCTARGGVLCTSLG